MDAKFKVGEEVLDTELGQVGIIREVYRDKQSGEFEYYVEFLQQILEGGVFRRGFPRLIKGRVCLESELTGGGESWARRWYNRMFR